MCGILRTLSFLLVVALASVHALAPPQASSSKNGHHCAARRRRPTMIYSSWTRELATGYERRVAADPSFAVKSAVEIVLAASTQLVAEYRNRGSSLQMLATQADFVVPAVLTAVAGKYMSMWKTAPTTTTSKEKKTAKQADAASATEQQQQQPHFLGQPVPTNAFQKTLLDGETVPTLTQRLLSLAAPVGPLFRAGCLASVLGYGVTALGIAVRTRLLPSYVPATHPVPVWAATLYTGCFVAVVSNLRYQLLQGVVEPVIEAAVANIPLLRAALVFLAKLGNGLLGSSLAIVGMQLCGLQKMKTT